MLAVDNIFMFVFVLVFVFVPILAVLATLAALLHRALRWRVFHVTDRYDGQKSFTVENGMRAATPLLLTLVFMEVADLVFAVAPIPAIFAVTTDPFLVFTSNVLAILGLRSTYLLLASVWLPISRC